MKSIKILSGGALKGLVSLIRPEFEAETDYAIEGDFGAVGGMQERLQSGEAADIALLSRHIIDALSVSQILKPDTRSDIGSVSTGVAMRGSSEPIQVRNGDELRKALLDADAIYFPDPTLATAGIHFKNVMARLGIVETLSARFRTFPSGNIAMKAMAESSDSRPIGCTQVTEIVSTSGVKLAGLLPDGYGLTTVYTAAICSSTSQFEIASRFIKRLSVPAIAMEKRKLGFH